MTTFVIEVKDKLVEVKDKFTDIISKVIEFGTTLIDKVAGPIKTAFDAVITVSETIWDKVVLAGGILASIFTNIGSDIIGVKNTFVTFVTDIPKKFIEIWDTVKTGASELWNGILGALRNIPFIGQYIPNPEAATSLELGGPGLELIQKAIEEGRLPPIALQLASTLERPTEEMLRQASELGFREQMKTLLMGQSPTEIEEERFQELLKLFPTAAAVNQNVTITQNITINTPEGTELEILRQALRDSTENTADKLNIAASGR